MADIKSKEARSRNMSAIKAGNTKPEIKIRKALFARGYRYRLHPANLPGKPDIVLPKYKTVLFIHGCFWHGHENCYLYKKPQTHRSFWMTKIEQNKKRDRLVIETLRQQGWRVLVVWECSIRGRYKLAFETVLDRIENFLHNDLKYDEIRSSE